jgi:hypothetical protein
MNGTLGECGSTAMLVPFNKLPIGSGLTPCGKPGATFYLDRNELELIRKDGPPGLYDDARFISEAVQKPDAIFEGLGRYGQRESLCYSVRPTADPDDEEEAATLPRYGQVFVVFVSPGQGGDVVFAWEWREEDPDLPGHSLHWQNDFARRTWQRT